ncbi:hypothetical protein K470DRAFT_222206, partial [Piedraia hortae CBS 480.64]
LDRLLVNGKFSDLRLVCNSRQWAVHRALLCSRSSFFDAACSHAFREARDLVVDLSDDDEEAVEQMICYFYRLDYDIQEQTPTVELRHRSRRPKKVDFSQIRDPLLEMAGLSPPSSPCCSPRQDTPPPQSTIMETDNRPPKLLLHVRVYALAEKYDIPGLKELARSKFEISLACHYDSPEVPEAIEEVYCSTIDSDRGLRDVIVQLFMQHPLLATTPAVRALLDDMSPFMDDIRQHFGCSPAAIPVHSI